MNYESYDNLFNEQCITLDKGDEIKKLTLEEDLSEIKRAEVILINGQQRQKLAIYKNLKQLFDVGFQVLYNIVQADLMEECEEIIVEAGNALKDYNYYHQELLDLTLHFLNSYNYQIAQAWLPVFGNLIKFINYKDQQDQIETLILNLCKPNQPEVGRLIGAQMIIQLSNFLKDKIKGPILDKFRSLCNDSDKEVRELIAGQVFTSLINNLNPINIQQYIEDKFNALLYDSQITVRQKMIVTFYTNIQKIYQSSSNLNIKQLFIDCLSTSIEDILIVSLKYCGQAFIILKQFADNDFQKNFTSLFIKFGYHQNSNIRYLYLYNLPGIIQNLDDMQLRIDIFTPYCEIIDEENNENKKLACIILHEIAKAFENNFISNQIFFILISAMNTQKLQNILSIQIHKIFQLIIDDQTNNFIKTQKQFKTIFQDYSKLFENCNTYQLKQTYLKQVYYFQSCIKPRQFEKYFLSNLYNLQQNRKNEKLAMKIVAQYFGNCNQYEIQITIRDTMNMNFYKGNFNKRIQYIHFISYVQRYISKKFFDQLHFYPVMNFLNDKIKDVQIQLIKNIQKLGYYIPEVKDFINLKTESETIKYLIKNKKFKEVPLDENEQTKFRLQEDNNYKNYMKQIKNKQQENSLSIDMNKTKQNKIRAPPKFGSLSSKKTTSSSLIRLNLQPQSKSSERISNGSNKVRPSGFNKF